MSSRTRSVTHFAGPPTSRVPPSNVAPFQQRKAGPHPSEEGRGSQPQFQVEERERGEEGGGEGGGRQERTQTETDPGDLVTCNVRWAGPSDSTLAPACTQDEQRSHNSEDFTIKFLNIFNKEC